jgi:hypothetical protein
MTAKDSPRWVGAVPVDHLVGPILTQVGLTTAIDIAAFTLDSIGYNSGTIVPNSYGTWFIYFLPPEPKRGRPPLTAEREQIQQLRAAGKSHRQVKEEMEQRTGVHKSDDAWRLLSKYSPDQSADRQVRQFSRAVTFLCSNQYPSEGYLIGKITTVRR